VVVPAFWYWYLPSDVACGDAFPGDGKEVGFKVVPATAIPDGWLGLDNGPQATTEIKAALADCKTILWNGPMGVFESSQFAKGTYDIAEYLAELTEKNGATTIIGGGDSVAAVNKSGLSDKMSHISTGGGASLELLEGKVLPGVAALDEAGAAFCGERMTASVRSAVALAAKKSVADLSEADLKGKTAWRSESCNDRC
jgi:phosphoglycerate kinase